MDPQEMRIRLSVIYRDLAVEEVIHPITHRMGAFSFPIIGAKFTQTNGVYSYRAELIDKEDKVVDTWQHRMWVEVLRL